MKIDRTNNTTNFCRLRNVPNSIQELNGYKAAKGYISGFAQYNHITFNWSDAIANNPIGKKIYATAQDLSENFSAVETSDEINENAFKELTKRVIKALETKRVEFHQKSGESIYKNVNSNSVL